MAGLSPPFCEAENRISVVQGEAIHDSVVVRAEAGKRVRSNGNAAPEGVVVVEDVVAYPVAGGAILDVEGPSAIVGNDDCVVVDEVACRGRATVDSVERDPAGVILVQQIVANDGVLDPIHVDAGAPSCAVAEDDVVLDHGPTDDAVSALRGISVHMDTVGAIVPDPIASDRRPITAIADIDTVFITTVGGVIRLDQQVVAEAGEDTPPSIAIQAVTAQGDVLAENGADSGSRPTVDMQALHKKVAGTLEVDPVGGTRIVAVDLDGFAGKCLYGDGERGSAGSRKVSAGKATSPQEY